MDVADLRGLLDRVAGAKVACVGDLMLDRYVYGEVSRISPEAPIPVLARRREKVMLGAAGNVARNVAALGARASLVGVVGDDPAGHEATELAGREATWRRCSPQRAGARRRSRRGSWRELSSC
jgi:D-beta-D-heptose 7-phosphate kinase/D-beta-D-heptose 1-phosphate adenosyltransferase